MDSKGHVEVILNKKASDSVTTYPGFNDPWLEVEDIKPRHAEKPKSFVLSANGERYRNTVSQRRKARKAQKQSRKKNR